MERPGLESLLAYAREGDTLAVVRLDRLGRSLGELLTTVAMLKERGIALLSLEQRIDTNSAAWARAQGVARLAMANVVPSVGSDVLWYHANYVAPSWGHRLNVVEKIGAHIFYRA